MSLLKKLAGLAVGAAALGAAAYVLKNREHGEEYEHIVGPEDEVEPETESAEPADEDASAVAEPAPAAAPEEPAAPAEEPKPKEPEDPEEPADAAETPAAKTPTGVPLVRHSRQATHKNHSFLAPDTNQNRHNPPDDQKPRQNRTNFREYIIFFFFFKRFPSVHQRRHGK